MINKELLKLHIVKRLPTIIGVALLSAVFGLYYFGFFDISFIERPESWKNNYEKFQSLFEKENEDIPIIVDPDTDDGDETEDTSDETTSNRPGKHEGENTPSSGELTFLSVSDMAEKGYHRTDKTFDSTCKFAILSPQYKLPRALTYGNKTVDSEVFEESSDVEGAEIIRKVERKDETRYALELYMGYILYDDIGTLYIIGPDGTVISKYDDNAYRPAYTRDLSGRPLFYAPYSETITYPTETKDKPDPDNPDEISPDKEWIKTSYITVDKKIYYYLTPGGYFAQSDYNDTTDNRGLYFDYPAYYGNSDNSQRRLYFNTTRIVTSKDKKETKLENSMNWMFTDKLLDIKNFKFDRTGKNLSDYSADYMGEEGKNSLSEMFPYAMAYNYSEGYAAVMTDVKWDYWHDEENEDGKTEQKHYDVTSREMRIIDTLGNIKFDSRKNFTVSMGGNTAWTANERYVMPLSLGLDSLGSFYFDHGLIRMRVQTYDRYYFTDLDMMHIDTDDSVLMRPDGSIFKIPSGYSLKSYSDGVLLLKKDSDGYYRYMDSTGAWINDKKYYDAGPFLEGVAYCKNSEGLYGVIDTKGNAVIPFRYEHISNISSGNLVAYKSDTGWTIFQKMTAE